MLTGAGLAILLLASSVINYVISERSTELFNTRREMAREMAVLDQLMHVQKPAAGALSGVLEQVVRESKGTLAWAQMVDREGTVIARSDTAAAPAFTGDYVASRIRERRPVFAVRDTSAGKVVVEAFAIRLPSYTPAASFKSVALKTGPGNMAFVELASFANAGLLAWPDRHPWRTPDHWLSWFREGQPWRRPGQACSARRRLMPQRLTPGPRRRWRAAIYA